MNDFVLIQSKYGLTRWMLINDFVFVQSKYELTRLILTVMILFDSEQKLIDALNVDGNHFVLIQGKNELTHL